MKVLLIDDHTLFRDALALLITQQLHSLTEVLQAGSLSQALAATARHADLALALLDLGLPDSQGLGSLAALREAAPQLTVIVLSADERRETILAAIDAGAAGFIPKTSQGSVLRDALRVIFDGGVYVPPCALEPSMPSHAAPADPLAVLSPRQIDVLRLLIEGKSNKLISRALDLSESTVKTHMAEIFRRLEVNNRTQAVLAAARLGPHLPRIS